MIYEKEKCPSWIYNGPEARAMGTVASWRADEVDRACVWQALVKYLQTHTFYWRVHAR